jgi:cytoskeletal protein CcmA (bactofilin family)
MALKDFMGKTGIAEPGEAVMPAPPRPPAPPSGALTTFLDASTNFSGKLKCTDSLRIDGRVEGEVHCDHKVVIGEPGVVHASIDADSVLIAGEVRGDINARSKITLDKTANVTGDLCTPGIVIQEGAKLEGRIMIGSDAGRAAEKPAARTAAPAEKAAAGETEKPAASTPATRPPPGPGAPPPAGG